MENQRKHKLVINPKHLIPYIGDPCRFVEDLVFKYYPVDPKPQLNRHQRALFEEIANIRCTGKEFITVRSGRGRGKTAGVALLIPWFLATRPRARVICTSPKADQLSDVLWAEISKWLNFSPLKEMLLWSKEKVEHIEMPNNWYAVARTAKTKENFSGFHEEHQMFIIDESSGVADDISETIEQTQVTNKTNNQHAEIITIHIGNPTKVTGYFFRSQKSPELDKYWTRLHFKPTMDEVAKDKGAQRLIAIYGMDHDVVQVGVFGEFPSGNPQAVISYAKAWAAMYEREVPAAGAIEMGVDVARFGDDMTVICSRRGYKAHPLKTYKKLDTVKVTEAVIEQVRDLRRLYNYNDVIRIKVDDTGVGGGVVDILRMNTEDNIEVVPCYFGGAGDQFYANGASVMWADTEKMMDKMELPRDEVLFEELVGRNWEIGFDNKNRRVLESKADFKKRVHRSPDRADALVLCCAYSQEKVKILPNLVTMRESVFRDVPIRFDRVLRKTAEVWCSVWHERNMTESCLVGIWDKEIGNLVLFSEGTSRMGGPGEMLSALDNVVTMYNNQHRTAFKPKNFRWYGNRMMFGLSEGSIEFTNIKDGPYLIWQNKHFIPLQPNFQFDLGGAILQMNKMFEEKRIVILPDMMQLRLQLETWAIDNEIPDTDDRGLCLALCNIISMMHQTKRLEKAPKPLHPYGITIKKDGTIIENAGKEAFLNRVQKLYSEGKGSAIRAFLPRAVNK